MKVCDRHPERRAAFLIHIPRDHTDIDLCDECKAEFLRFLQPPESPKRVKRKDSAQAD